MSKERIITQDEFNALLDWLDPDREQAGHKYETIRQSLIRIFVWRGYSEAEDMADETINRVTQSMPKVKPTYVGSPAPYFYSVANHLLMECERRKKKQVPFEEVSEAIGSEGHSPPENQEDDIIEQEHECLSRCLQQLEPDKRRLILAYYQKDKHAKIDHRKQLAEEENLDLNALRVRVHRIRARLEKCIEHCLQQSTGDKATPGEMD